jgi:hypothetical protein
MGSLSLKMTFRTSRVFGVRPGDVSRHPDSPEVAA